VLRDLRSQKGWFVSIVVLVAMSSAIYSSFLSSYDAGIGSIDRANGDLDAPDIIVSTLPAAAVDLTATLGVARASPALLVQCYTLLPDGTRVRGEVTSVVTGDRVNDYRVLRGTDLAGAGDVVVEQHYADAHDVGPGQAITIHAGGDALELRVAGVCFAPAHIYLISSEGWIESDYGIFYVAEGVLGPLVNTYYVEVSEGASVGAAATAVVGLLASGGVDAVATPADQGFAGTAVKEDLGALNSMTALFCGLLLGVYAFTLYVVLSRLIDRRRHEIGVLRAMGYTRADIFAHFMSFSAIAVVVGTLLSVPLGYLILQRMMTYYAVNLLGLPTDYLALTLGGAYVVEAALLAAAFSVLGSFFPAYRAASMRPAEAMRPYIAQTRGARAMVGSRVSPLGKLPVREALGHGARSAGTVVIVAVMLSMGLSFALMMVSMQDGLDARFSEHELWDVRVSFAGTQGPAALDALRAVPGVEAVEPVTDVAADVSSGGRHTYVQLYELEANTTMYRLGLAEGHQAPGGLIVSGDVARRLHASVGDPVTVLTPLGTMNTTVTGVLGQFSASEAYVLTDLGNSTGAVLTVAEGGTRGVEDALRGMPAVESWVRKAELKSGWDYLISQYYGIVVIMDLVVVMLVLMVVGVFAFISTRERAWELVILKSMGFTGPQVMLSGIATFLLLSVVGVLLGVPLSMRLSDAFGATFADFMTLPPTSLAPATTAWRSLLVVGASLLAVVGSMRSVLRRSVAESLRAVFDTL
jgi:putative ABC transport system permease protein